MLRTQGTQKALIWAACVSRVRRMAGSGEHEARLFRMGGHELAEMKAE